MMYTIKLHNVCGAWMGDYQAKSKHEALRLLRFNWLDPENLTARAYLDNIQVGYKGFNRKTFRWE